MGVVLPSALARVDENDAGGAEADPVRAPNIIMILVDDVGYDDIGCYWTENDEVGFERIATPNIDQMAAEGIRFTDFYAPAPACTPSRAGFLTGCYAPRVGLSRPDDGSNMVLSSDSDLGLNPGEVTIADALRDRGYATGCVGKWHLGRGKLMPGAHGFDFHFGPAARPKQHSEKVILTRHGRFVDAVDHEQLTNRYTMESVAFIEAYQQRPFFLYLSHDMAHQPLAVSTRFRGLSERGRYGSVIMEIDWSVGVIFDTLRRLGIDDDTLVLFTSDNGPVLHPTNPHYEYNPGGRAYPLRAGKATVYEGGVRVPCVARWPGHVPADTVCREPVSGIDLLPTFACLAGATMPDERAIDGRDITPLLLGEKDAKSPHEAIYFHHIDRLMAMRSGRWKLHFGLPVDVPEDGPPDLTPAALYDLSEDIGESHDVLADHPEVTERLLQSARELRAVLGDANTGVLGSGCRPAGHAGRQD